MISILNKNDKNRLLDYIKNHWNSNHVFLRNFSVFEFQHNTDHDKYNFLIFDRNDSISAILGFITIKSNCLDQIWLALWHSNSGLDGFMLLKYIEKQINPNFIGVVGISDVAKKVYRSNKFKIGQMSHYYVSHPNGKSKVVCKKIENTDLINKYKITRLDTLDDSVNSIISNSKYFPIKDFSYYKRRFDSNLFYKYDFLYVTKNNEILIVFIGRIVLIEDYKIFHCVDCIGDFAKIKLKKIIQDYLIANEIDIFEMLYFSSDEKSLDFYKKNDLLETIPTFFNPLEMKNINIDLAYKSNYDYVQFFIGDSDQDRPN